MKRDGLTFFPAYFECTKGMGDKQCRSFLYALADYAFDDIAPCFPDGSMEQALWVVLKPSMDKSKFYKERSEKAAAASSQKRATNNSSNYSSSYSSSYVEHKLKPTKTIDNDYDHDLDIDTGLDHDADTDTDTGLDIDAYASIEKKKEKKEKFRPPTVEEVRAYCTERNNGIDPEAFIAYYESQGWKKANGAKVVDWKGCVRTWEQKDKERRPQQQQQAYPNDGWPPGYFEELSRIQHSSGRE